MSIIKNKTIVFSFFFLLLYFCAIAQKKGKQAPLTPPSEISQLNAEGTAGVYLVKVYTYGRDIPTAIENAKIFAINTVLFQGLTSGTNGSPEQKPPIVSSNTNLNDPKIKDFFNNFFLTATYNNFITSIHSGTALVDEYFQYKKHLIKIGISFNINEGTLRKYLENAGIIRSLNSGF